MTDEQFNILLQRLDRIERSMPDPDEIVAKVINEVAGLLAPIQCVTDETLDLLLTPPDDLDD